MSKRLNKKRTKNYIIYLITCLNTNKQYVGLTTYSIEKRWHEHCSEAKRGTSGNLYDSIREYGKTNHNIKPICLCDNLEDLLKNEKLYIKQLDTYKNGLNMTTGGDFYKLSEESRKKCSVAKFGNKFGLGYKHTTESKIKISQAQKGVRETPQAVEKNRLSHLGKKQTEKQIQNQIFAQRKLPPKKGRYKGVCFDKSKKFFRATLGLNGKQIHIGSYKTEKEAAQAYNNAIMKYWGKGDWYYNDIILEE